MRGSLVKLEAGCRGNERRPFGKGASSDRESEGLYACGAYERIYVKVSPRVTVCYYRLKE